MKKALFITLVFSLTLFARENPFSPQPEQTIEPTLIKPEPIVKEIIAKEPPKIIKTIPIAKTIPAPVKKPKKKIIKKKVLKPKLIYNGQFLKIKLFKNSIKILTDDKMLKHFKLKSPNRLVVDFERFDVEGPFSKKIYSLKIEGLKVGHHDYFYRATFKLKKNYPYKIIKKPYGYLITL